jgi:hypothetical protein
LLKGRQAGLWSEGQKPGFDHRGTPNDPTVPTGRRP